MITLTVREIVDHACTCLEEFSAGIGPEEAVEAFMEAHPQITPEDFQIVAEVGKALGAVWIQHGLLKAPPTVTPAPKVSDETLNAMWKEE